MSEIYWQNAQISPAKRLGLYLTHHTTRSKSPAFFPAKRLSFFSLISRSRLKAQTSSRVFFNYLQIPLKALNIFRQNT